MRKGIAIACVALTPTGMLPSSASARPSPPAGEWVAVAQRPPLTIRIEATSGELVTGVATRVARSTFVVRTGDGAQRRLRYRDVRSITSLSTGTVLYQASSSKGGRIALRIIVAVCIGLFFRFFVLPRLFAPSNVGTAGSGRYRVTMRPLSDAVSGWS